MTKTKVKEQSFVKIVNLDMNTILPPDEPSRKLITEESIDVLASSIAASGQLQSIAVTKKNEGYEIIYGHRRYLAMLRLHKKNIKAQVYPADSKRVLLLRFHENTGREDLTPYERALELDRLQRKLKLNQTRLATVTGLSQSLISQYFAILSWPEPLRYALNDAKISFSVGRELSRLDREEDLRYYLNQIIQNGASLRVVKDWVDNTLRHASTVEEEIDTTDLPPASITHEPSTAKCYLCEQPGTFDKMQNVWVHRECMRETILAAVEQKEN